MACGSDERKRKVAYFYEPSIGDFDYGKQYFMKRIRMTDNLVQSFDLYKHMDIVKPFRADEKQLTMFHSKDYMKFLKSVAPGMIMNALNKKKFTKFCIDADCPPFDGVYEFSQISAGGSICAASYLNNKKADIAINWAGGQHHAKMTHASSFCYVNDIVLGILELLKSHDRVLYVDIDIHHGDGVEEAFYTTDRVMKVSFHKYGGNFFPETGNFIDVGHGVGENYNVNVPLDVGIDDTDFRFLFEPVIQKVMEVYQPNAVVLQCGADSLAGDPIGEFNLSIKGHASCLEFLRSFNVPLMVLGGGGYKPENVARCWCYETSVAVGVEINSDHPSLSLVGARSYRNKNKRKDLEELRNLLIERISRLPNSPSVQFMHVVPQTKVPEEAEDPIERRPKSRILKAEVDD